MFQAKPIEYVISSIKMEQLFKFQFNWWENVSLFALDL
jgi:hypothetical protein